VNPTLTRLRTFLRVWWYHVSGDYQRAAVRRYAQMRHITTDRAALELEYGAAVSTVMHAARKLGLRASITLKGPDLPDFDAPLHTCACGRPTPSAGPCSKCLSETYERDRENEAVGREESCDPTTN
jgi:hypothetical protein